MSNIHVEKNARSHCPILSTFSIDNSRRENFFSLCPLQSLLTDVCGDRFQVTEDDSIIGSN
jgi:hypothetical protein